MCSFFFLSTDLVGEEGNSLPVNLGTERRQVVRILRQHWKQMLDRPSHFPFGCFLEDAGESVTEKFSSLLTYTNHVASKNACVLPQCLLEPAPLARHTLGEAREHRQGRAPMLCRDLRTERDIEHFVVLRKYIGHQGFAEDVRHKPGQATVGGINSAQQIEDRVTRIGVRLAQPGSRRNRLLRLFGCPGTHAEGQQRDRLLESRQQVRRQSLVIQKLPPKRSLVSEGDVDQLCVCKCRIATQVRERRKMDE